MTRHSVQNCYETIVTPERVSDRWLSLHCWLVRTVLPAALSLVAVLALLRAINPDPKTLDHTSVMVGFAALYFCLFRGGHILMIRSLHSEMMKKHAEAYREKLGTLKESDVKRRNLGFTLARVKRDILVEAREAKAQKSRDLFPK